MPDLFSQTVALGDVAHHCQQAQRTGQIDARQADLGIEGGAVDTQRRPGEMLGRAPRRRHQMTGQHCARCTAPGLVDGGQTRQLAAKQHARFGGEQRGGTRVGIGDTTVFDAQHRVGGAVDQGACQLFTFAQGVKRGVQFALARRHRAGHRGESARQLANLVNPVGVECKITTAGSHRSSGFRQAVQGPRHPGPQHQQQQNALARQRHGATQQHPARHLPRTSLDHLVAVHGGHQPAGAGKARHAIPGPATVRVTDQLRTFAAVSDHTLQTREHRIARQFQGQITAGGADALSEATVGKQATIAVINHGFAAGELIAGGLRQHIINRKSTDHRATAPTRQFKGGQSHQMPATSRWFKIGARPGKVRGVLKQCTLNRQQHRIARQHRCHLVHGDLAPAGHPAAGHGDDHFRAVLVPCRAKLTEEIASQGRRRDLRGIVSRLGRNEHRQRWAVGKWQPSCRTIDLASDDDSGAGAGGEPTRQHIPKMTHLIGHTIEPRLLPRGAHRRPFTDVTQGLAAQPIPGRLIADGGGDPDHQQGADGERGQRLSEDTGDKTGHRQSRSRSARQRQVRGG